MKRSNMGAFALAAVVMLAGTLPCLAQAAVQSDTPVPGRAPAAAGLGAATPGGSAATTHDLLVPNPATAPGSPGTTGTGAAGTGPTGTMAAPGR